MLIIKKVFMGLKEGIVATNYKRFSNTVLSISFV